MYDAEMTRPMREELTRIGIKEMLTAGDVAKELDGFKGTAAVLVNSVCGCAAGGARPGFAMALANTPVRPDKILTVFAGVDREATAAVRERIPAPPSSPCIVLFKDGKPTAMMHRSDIEVRDAGSIAAVLTHMFEEFCAKATTT